MSTSFDTGDFSTIHAFRGGVRREIELRDYTLEYNVPCWYRLIEDGVCLDVFLHLRPGSKYLLVSGQDALIDGRSELPYFYRTKWAREFDCSFVTFNDPTLYLDRALKCGWFQYPGRKAFKLLNAFLSSLLDKLGTTQRCVCFYGASAGGYWALANSVNFPEARYVVDIPQTNLETYPNAVQIALLKTAVGTDSVHSVFDYWDNAPLPQHLLYLQNERDIKHTRLQLSHFMYGVAQRAIENRYIKNLEVRFHNDDNGIRGHSPLPEAQTIALLKEILLSLGA